MKLSSNELVGTTLYTIHKLNEYKNGGNALMLYFAYTEQSRIQETNQSRSTDIFMMKKLNWSCDKLQSAKKTLKELGLIDIVQVREKYGKIHDWYVRTNFLINEQKIRTSNLRYEIEVLPPETENPLPGKSSINALSIKTNALSIQKEKNVTVKQSLTALDSEFGINLSYINDVINKNLPKEKRKNLATLLNMCRRIRRICRGLDILPIYDKDTIGATHILWQNGWLNDFDLFIDKLRLNRDTEVCDYKELIRQDYYLPNSIDSFE